MEPGHYDVILGMHWSAKYNSKINWLKRTIVIELKGSKTEIKVKQGIYKDGDNVDVELPFAKQLATLSR